MPGMGGDSVGAGHAEMEPGLGRAVWVFRAVLIDRVFAHCWKGGLPATEFLNI